MKFGVNTFIWSANFDRSNLPLLPRVKGWGFDGVEVPLFRPAEFQAADIRKGLGTFIILDHIVRAARAGLPYVYLGYWVEGSTRMDYKTRFRPLERLGRDGWRRIDEIDADAREKPVELPFRRERRRLVVDG